MVSFHIGHKSNKLFADVNVLIIKKKVFLLFAVFILWTLFFTLQKPVFLLFFTGSIKEMLPVMVHGLWLDCSVAGYFTVIPGVLLLLSCIPFSCFHSQQASQRFGRLNRAWLLLAVVLAALGFVANMALYGYWQFPLDATPVFFITSSPKDALASVEWWQGLLGLCSVVALSWLGYRIFSRVLSLFEPSAYKSLPLWATGLILLLVAALFVPIRGGFKVSSNNTGKVYYSQNQILNHAAVNPLFSFLESVAHQEDFASQYRYMDDDKAQRLAASMRKGKRSTLPGNYPSVLSSRRPDIYLLILESFSDTLMHQRGVTPCLIQARDSGIYFSRFYANSFRTDRGLLSILQGYPAPATVSLMKYPKKTAAIPSLSAHLKRAGWDLQYYYGGDADFTNMRSFLINQGFNDIVEDVDFSVADRLSKWGVPDHLLFRRVENDLGSRPHASRPVLRVVQTSSSHEPFDVPYHRLADKSLNAFAYTDSCVGGFIRKLRATREWEHSLVIIVPDHLGAWPAHIDNFAPSHFHIPLIWTGGAISKPMVVHTYGSQQDIAATLLGQLRIAHDDMIFSKDLFDAQSPHFAFFMMNDGFGLIDEDNMTVYDHKARRKVMDAGAVKGKNLLRGQAYVQTLFDDISRK